MSDYTFKPALKYSQNELAAMNLWALIYKTGTVLDDEAVTLADLTGLLEFDGSGYIRVPLENLQVTDDSANDRWAKLSCDPIQWPVLGSLEDENATGIIIYAETGTPWDEYDEYPVDGEDLRLPIMNKDSGGFPINPANAEFSWTPSSEGLTYKVSKLPWEIL